MAGRRVTIYDVAERAGVSIATVSQTLNRPQRVNAATRDRVLQTIDELGFVPKASAVSRARKALGRVGVVAPFTTYESFQRRLMGTLETSAVEVVVFDEESAASATSPLLASLPVTDRLDGVLIMGLPLDDSLAARLRSTGLPTVLVDSTHEAFSSVGTDDVAGGALVGRHLIERGRERVVYLSEPQLAPDWDSQGLRRITGLSSVVADVRHVVTDRSVEGGRAALRALHAAGALPEAVFAHDDLLAAGVVAECALLGIRVPDDVAVVGFDDGALADAMGITTVRQPLEETGRVGMRLLRETMAGASPTQRVTLPLELIVRATS